MTDLRVEAHVGADGTRTAIVIDDSRRDTLGGPVIVATFTTDQAADLIGRLERFIDQQRMEARAAFVVSESERVSINGGDEPRGITLVRTAAGEWGVGYALQLFSYDETLKRCWDVINIEWHRSEERALSRYRYEIAERERMCLGG